MDLKSLILETYPTVGPFEGINTVEARLLESNFLVVMDEEKEFYGVLCPLDLVKRPHKIVVDCITKKESVSISDTTLDVIEKFRKNRCSALAVMQDESFIGVIEKKQLLYDLERKVKGLYEKSLISDKTKSYFLNNLSHEIRTPLNGIIGFIDIIDQVGTVTDVVKNERFANILKTSAERFLLVMNDLFELSLMHAGDEIVIENEEIDIDALFEELKLFFEDLLKIQGKSVEINNFRCNYSGLICNADSSRRRAFITSTESSYRNIKKKILTLACFQESFSSLQSFQQQSVV